MYMWIVREIFNDEEQHSFIKHQLGHTPIEKKLSLCLIILQVLKVIKYVIQKD